MAVSLEGGSLFSHPASVEDPVRTARLLAPHLEMDARSLRARLKQSLSFVWLARQLPMKKARAVQKLGLSGIGMEKEGKRIDPADLLIGFYRHLEGRIPEELRSEFSSLDPDRFDSTYKALREKAKQSDVGVDEICHALREIAAVTRYFADHLRNSDRGTNL